MNPDTINFWGKYLKSLKSWLSDLLQKVSF